ncbi:NAD(P)H dehydrogenase (quinone) [Maritalea myrionectae]|uniref:NAD(P)H dehydrogenase (Quinone) n=1 Tax=Maritalea myrionectae TaxID=454601 RepID=A0A2R4MGA4_9HYPH|nr:NAD(P)H-dependent oxidoreductase [Maritalea myrionectae]AVX05042.1 NAD(P)H dehydrogenase (quinone) [Maritalea myrionectae]
MSNVLVISAHPLKDSLCAHLTEQIKARLATRDAMVVHRDLYDQHFDPRLQPEERASFYTTYDQSRLKEEIAELEAADILILVFPTWWFGFPAILKGWFDRVWAPGVAFDHAEDLSALHPKLDNLKHVIGVTTMGSPWWVDRLILWRPVRRILKTALVGVCAPKAKFDFIVQYQAEKMDPRKLDRLLHRIQKLLACAID